MIEIKPLRLLDLIPLCSALSLEERALVVAMTGEMFDAERVAMAAHAGSAMAWSFESPSRAVAAGGYLRERPGVFRTWFVAPDSAWYAHGAGLTRAVRDVIHNTLAENAAHRIETVTLADRHRARAWYEKIGLSYESTLRGYGANGEDAVMYVALRDAEKR